MSKYVRYQPTISRHSDSNVDEDNWLHKFEKSLQKGGVQPKNVDNSLFYQINNIMNGRSKYPSVAAAVEDMKARSGLTDYLAKLNKISEEECTKNKKLASHNVYYQRGFDMGKYDAEKDQASDIVAGLRALKNPVPYEHWMEYAHGYIAGVQLSENDVNHELNIVKTVLNKHLKKASDQNNIIDKDIPIVIKKVPSIKNTLENYIRDTKGNISIPAIIEKIKSIHRGDISEDKDWDDDNLMKFVSKMNLEAKRDNPDNFQQYNNLGARDYDNNADIDPSNTDAFYALNPVKI